MFFLTYLVVWINIKNLPVRDDGTIDLFFRLKKEENMSPIYVMIDLVATGNRIKELMELNDVKVCDLQKACGFERPQAVYKWLSGKSLPSMENMVVIRIMLHTTIDDILVIHLNEYGNDNYMDLTA